MTNLADQSDEPMDATVFREQTRLRDDSSVSLTDGSTSGWGSPMAPGSAAGEDVTPRLLKQRFALEELIGTGGMGSVYRAKDLRRVEARDAKPYIAVKVLNNDFRKHPEAFIALEREASKSQGLRHSNIVSIFDFDKDGEVPFITMELLEGTELAELLREYPNGLPDDQAWRIIEGMVRGLAHAHDEEVVHADFKPGNVYITERGSKILDFGIARAMRLNRGGEDTDFDPARLAALTPAYASREMLNGDNPEARDDLYSLGVVMYLVLTGHHPFGRLPADQAASEGVEPDRIRHISRRRWRAIKQCLQFNRQQRPANASEVYEALFGRPLWQTWGLAGAGVVIALAALGFTMQEQAELDEVKEEVRQEALVDAQVARIDALLQQPQFDENWQRTLYSEASTLHTLGASQPIKGDVLQQIEQAYIAHTNGLEDLGLAIAQLEIAQHFGPVDGLVSVLRERVVARLNDLQQAPIDPAWLNDANRLLGYADAHFAGHVDVVIARQALVDHLQDEILHLLDSGQVTLAEQAWAAFSSQIFDEEVWSATQQRMAQAVAAARLEAQRAAVRAELAAVQRQFDDLLEVSCLRLDLEAIGTRLTRLQTANPAHADTLRGKVGGRIGHCAAQLGAVDPARGESLLRAAEHRLGVLPQLSDSGVDPCGLHYLVGNGRLDGPGGYCTDERGLEAAPRLVVVPAANGVEKFAITKRAISWAELAVFCNETGTCTVPETVQSPVTGLPSETVRAFADWLSAQTGRTYRLPTMQEWLLAASGDTVPTARCTLPDPSVAGRDGRNLFGLVIGAPVETIWISDGAAAAGAEPSCAAQLTPDEIAGRGLQPSLRLVREVS